MRHDPVATPPRFRLRLQDAFGNALPNTRYRIGWQLPGGASLLPEPPLRQTDANGILEEPIPDKVTRGGIIVFINSTLKWGFEINVTDLLPASSSPEGLAARLSNLGLMALEQADTPADTAALTRAQSRYKLLRDIPKADAAETARRVEQEHDR